MFCEPQYQGLSHFPFYKGGKGERTWDQGCVFFRNLWLQITKLLANVQVKVHCLFCLQTAQCDVQLTGELMEQALWRWDADKIGIPDYALESSGKSRLHFLLCLINWVFFSVSVLPNMGGMALKA